MDGVYVKQLLRSPHGSKTLINNLYSWKSDIVWPVGAYARFTARNKDLSKCLKISLLKLIHYPTVQAQSARNLRAKHQKHWFLIHAVYP